MTPSRYFSVEQANRALPEVERLLLRLREVQRSAMQTKERLDVLWQRLESGEPVLAEISALQRNLDAQMEELGGIAARVEEIGCLLRDVEMGLVDFPALADGTEIYLCWRLGEDGIRHWHGMHEGYAGRKHLTTMPGLQVH